MEPSYESLALWFKGLAHPTRLQILALLRTGEMCVCHLEVALSRRQSYISQQLMTLRDAGLVHSRRVGLQVYYRLSDTRIVDLLNTIYGTNPQSVIRQLEGCPCPACAVISIAEVQ